MASILFIKGADFSENAIGKIEIPVFAKSGSADEGTLSTGETSKQTRFWFPFVPTIGKTYKAELSVTNGSESADPRFTDFGAVRFVNSSSARTGLDLIVVRRSDGISPIEYEIEGTAECDASYSYIYLNLAWALEYPTKYPNFVLKIYEEESE